MKQYLLYPYNDNFIESIDEQFNIFTSSDFQGEYPSFEASHDILEFDEFFGPQKILTDNIELDTLITPAIWDLNNTLLFHGVNYAIRFYLQSIRNGRTKMRVILIGGQSEIDFIKNCKAP